MKKLLNTLYVTRQDTYLHKEGETVVIEQNHQVLMRLPLHTLNGIVTFGNVVISPYLSQHCTTLGICVTQLSEHGHFLARIEGPVSGNVLLRIAQFKAFDNPEMKAMIARSFLLGKIANARTVMLRCLRDHGDNEEMQLCCQKHLEILGKLKISEPDVNRYRGFEGEAAAAYFQCFNHLLVTQKDDFSISSRTRRPPADPLNALLSFLYTLLAHECRGALEGVGLDPQIGFLHELRPGRPALALDLMEEFRSAIADRVACSLVNLKQVTRKDFTFSESGAVMMSDDCRKTVINAWQKKKQEVIYHPFFDEKLEIGLLPHAQAMLLARMLRRDIDAYPPFILK